MHGKRWRGGGGGGLWILITNTINGHAHINVSCRLPSKDEGGLPNIELLLYAWL